MLKNNPDIRYVIHSNGAVVFDKLTQKRIMNCISNADGRYILDVLASCDSHITYREYEKNRTENYETDFCGAFGDRVDLVVRFLR